MAQWVDLCAPNAGGPGSIPEWGTGAHMLQLRVHMLQLRVHMLLQLKTLHDRA